MSTLHLAAAGLRVRENSILLCRLRTIMNKCNILFTLIAAALHYPCHTTQRNAPQTANIVGVCALGICDCRRARWLDVDGVEQGDSEI